MVLVGEDGGHFGIAMNVELLEFATSYQKGLIQLAFENIHDIGGEVYAL